MNAQRSAGGRGRVLAAAGAIAVLSACTPRARGPVGLLDSGRFGPASGGPDGRAVLDRGGARAASEVLAVEPGAAGDRISALLEVPAASCALVIARGSASVEDVDLFAYGEDGAVLGVDEAPDATPAVLVCPPHPGRIFLVARIASGHGLVALGAERVPPEEAARAAERAGATAAARAQRRELGAFGDLEAIAAERRASLAGRWRELRRVALPIDAQIPATVTASIEADGCLDVLAIPDDSVAQLELTVLDEHGAIVARGVARGEQRTAVVCSPAQTPVTVEVRPHAGRGLAAVVVAGTERGAHAEVVTPERVDVGPIGELGAELAALARRVGARAGAPRRLHGGEARVGSRASHDLELPAGCARLDVVGGRPLRGLRAWMYDAGGQLTARARGWGRATLFACGAGGRARLDVEATMAGGAYAVELRPLPGARDELTRQPLAAARLLARLDDRGLDASAAGLELRAETLGAGTLRSDEVTVPPGQCLEAGLALGTGASGAELRLVARGSRLELARGLGADGAWASACSTGSAPAEWVIESSVGAGSAPALRAWRTGPPR